MFTWLIANGATIIIAFILLILVFFAGRKVLKNRGGCSCGNCSNCSSCIKSSAKEEENADK